MSQVEASKALNVTPAAVCIWESGAAKPTADNLAALARLYGCTTDELLGLETAEQGSA